MYTTIGTYVHISLCIGHTPKDSFSLSRNSYSPTELTALKCDGNTYRYQETVVYHQLTNPEHGAYASCEIVACNHHSNLTGSFPALQLQFKLHGWCGTRDTHRVTPAPRLTTSRKASGRVHASHQWCCTALPIILSHRASTKS